MIGKLRGVVDSVGEDWTVIDVGGVGYLVACSTRTLAALPATGEATTLAIETYVREDQIRLFGFLTDLERDWFRLLQTVPGVGTKVALGILSTLKTGELASAIALGDRTAIARAPGVGPKVAQRILTELKDRTPAFSGVPTLAALGTAEVAGTPGPVADAVSALVNLGYGQTQAAAAVAAALRGAGNGAETSRLIRLGLKELAQ